MKLGDFNIQIERLIKVYGQNKYPSERVDMIFESVGMVDADIFKGQISYFIGALEKAPMLNEFVQALGSVLGDAKKRAIEGKLKLIRDCVNCNGTGHVTMYDKKDGCEFAFQCTCERGPLLQSGFPKQYSAMGEDYASHRAWAVGRFDRLDTIRKYYRVNVDQLCTPEVTGSLLKPLCNTLSIGAKELMNV